LESVGATINDIVMLRIFVTDLEAFQKTGDVRKKYFGKYRPATTGLEISRLYFPEALIEVEATAVIGSGSSEEAIKPKSI
jgi:enamine deaminase RidA (YjgF/YER057c/UK114 family)